MKDKTAVIYTRVSDPDQVNNYSLSAQEIDTRNFAKQHNIQIKKVFTEEGHSAKSLDRPEFNNLMRFI